MAGQKSKKLPQACKGKPVDPQDEPKPQIPEVLSLFSVCLTPATLLAILFIIATTVFQFWSVELKFFAPKPAPEKKEFAYAHYTLTQKTTYRGLVQEIRYPNGYIYKGQLLGGLRHGYGVLWLPDNERYSGYFKKDKFYGEGTYIYSDQSSYIGQWSKGKYHGSGEIRYKNFDIRNPDDHYTWIFSKWINGSTAKPIKLSAYENYHGEMKGEKIHGLGVYKNKNGKRRYIFKGHHWNGLKHGFGIEKMLASENPSIYKGMWEKNNKTGFGQLITYTEYPHRWFKYTGNFKNNQAHGHGILIHSEGLRKIGNFKNGYPHGYITEQNTNGTLYRGFFKEGARNSQAYYKDQFNQVIFSNWTKNVKNHFTLAKNTDGSAYLGEMNTHESKFHGFGTYYYRNGLSYIKCHWDKGNTIGNVEIVYNSRGEKYVGEYQNQVRHGVGTYYVFEGFKVESRWKKGKAYGVSRISYKHMLEFHGFIVKNKFYSLWNKEVGVVVLGWTCNQVGNC